MKVVSQVQTVQPGGGFSGGVSVNSLVTHLLNQAAKTWGIDWCM